MRKMKKSFITITVIFLTLFFAIAIIAVNQLNSQLTYSNERQIIEKQVYYNAYAGVQKAIYEIKMKPNYETDNYFTIDTATFNSSDITQNKYYTELKVNYNVNGNIYTYYITSTGYGNFGDLTIKKEITSNIIVDYNAKNGIIKIDTMDIK